MSYPPNHLYHNEHAWLLVENNDEAVIGITFFAQDTLGDIVEIDSPSKGSMISRGVACGTVESRKTISDFIAPASGVVIEINESLKSEPLLANDDPHFKGWIARIKLSNPSEVSELMTAEQYKKFIGE